MCSNDGSKIVVKSRAEIGSEDRMTGNSNQECDRTVNNCFYRRRRHRILWKSVVIKYNRPQMTVIPFPIPSNPILENGYVLHSSHFWIDKRLKVLIYLAKRGSGSGIFSQKLIFFVSYVTKNNNFWLLHLYFT